MSDKMRWRFGDTNPVIAAVNRETEIEIGSLVFQDTNNAKPASAEAHGTHEANAEKFVEYFLGVAMQRSRNGDTDPIRVATTGVFGFDCPASTFELGDLIGPAGEEETLANQRVCKAPAPCYAIGRVARREPVASSIVLVDVRSTVMTGGVKGSIREED